MLAWDSFLWGTGDKHHLSWPPDLTWQCLGSVLAEKTENLTQGPVTKSEWSSTQAPFKVPTISLVKKRWRIFSPKLFICIVFMKTVHEKENKDFIWQYSPVVLKETFWERRNIILSSCYNSPEINTTWFGKKTPK